MANDPVHLSLPEVLNELETVVRDARDLFGELSPEQINWKPDPDQWSVGQCIDHLIVTNRTYFPVLEEVGKGQYRMNWWQRMPLFPGFFGRMMIGALNPDSTQKFKAPKGFQPASSDVDPQIVNLFADHQRELINLIASTRSEELDKIVIYSPVTKIITYSILNTYRIIALHERRHFKQAERVMKMQRFPK